MRKFNNNNIYCEFIMYTTWYVICQGFFLNKTFITQKLMTMI